MAKKKPEPAHENLERWLVSYGDFITLLFATFVVLYALSQIDLTEFAALEDSIRKAFNAPSILEGSDSILDSKGASILEASAADSTIAPLMLEYISQKYEDQSFEDIKDAINQMSKNGDMEGIDAQLTDKGLLITMKNDLLFYSGSATLTDKAMKTLDNVGVLIGEKFALHYIRVEGHTDNQPINTFMFPSNWELSGARSSSIIRYLITRFKFMPNIFTAVGYGDTRPIVDNKTVENRNKNRRVEILVLKNKFKSFEHATSSVMKQPKKEQEAFQAERMATIQRIKNGSKAFENLETTTVEDEVTQIESSSINNNSKDATKEANDRKKSLSIKNKTIYEQSSNVTTKTRKDDDDAWINDAKHDKILQKDINKQFDMVGQ